MTIIELSMKQEVYVKLGRLSAKIITDGCKDPLLTALDDNVTNVGYNLNMIVSITGGT